MKLTAHFGIDTPKQSFHMHNEHKVVERYIYQLQDGDTIALVSDAGTPGISDPGFLLIRAAVAAGIEIITLPGATAFVPAIVSSGLPCDTFYFEGFLNPNCNLKIFFFGQEIFVGLRDLVLLYSSF